MDILRLPVALRRSILRYTCSALATRRSVTTTTNNFRPYDEILDDQPSNFQAGSQALFTLSSTTLNSYAHSNPPDTAQLKYASHFFHTAPPTLLFSAANFRSFPPSPFPEVAFLGRSNVGKSSLLNALFGRTNARDAHVSKRPGRTKTMNGFGVSGGLPSGRAPDTPDKQSIWRRFPRGGLVVVDMPGYGGGSREEWGTEVMKYLERRKQLRRTFALVDAEHGLKASDISLLTNLRRQGISHQIVLSKVDKLLFSGSKAPGPQGLHNRLLKIQDLCASVRHKVDLEAGDGRQGVGDILCCSAEKSIENKNRKLGVDEMRWAILSACGMESDESGHKKARIMDEIQVLEEDN